MRTIPIKRCIKCGEPMRRIHHSHHGLWCWNCDPYRSGSIIENDPPEPSRLDRIAERATIEFLKSLVFIAVGYGWAVVAYGVFPR